MGIRVLPVGDHLAHIEPTTEEPSSLGHSPTTPPSTHKRTTTRRAQQQQAATSSNRNADAHTFFPVVVAVGLFPNAVLADVVGIRTRTPRHNRTQGVQQQQKKKTSRRGTTHHHDPGEAACLALVTRLPIASAK